MHQLCLEPQLISICLQRQFSLESAFALAALCQTSDLANQAEALQWNWFRWREVLSLKRSPLVQVFPLKDRWLWTHLQTRFPHMLRGYGLHNKELFWSVKFLHLMINRQLTIGSYHFLMQGVSCFRVLPRLGSRHFKIWLLAWSYLVVHVSIQFLSSQSDSWKYSQGFDLAQKNRATKESSILEFYGNVSNLFDQMWLRAFL